MWLCPHMGETKQNSSLFPASPSNSYLWPLHWTYRDSLKILIRVVAARVEVYAIFNSHTICMFLQPRLKNWLQEALRRSTLAKWWQQGTKIPQKGLAISIDKWLWCCVMFLEEKAKVEVECCTRWKSHHMKVGELGCFLSEYQNLVNEQIFVFRKVTVFSLGTSPDVASETFDSHVWEELCMKKITFCLCQKHAHQCTTLERSESQKAAIPDLSPPHKTSFFSLFLLGSSEDGGS